MCAKTYITVVSVKASEDLEDRESLAQIAASQNEQTTADGETYIEKYIRGVSAFESVLTLDRLRQVLPPGACYCNSCMCSHMYISCLFWLCFTQWCKY